MKTIVLKDKSITKHETVTKRLADFYAKHTPLRLKFDFVETDFSDLPIQEYYGGNYGIEKAYISGLTKDIKKEYGAWSHDNVMLAVSKKNWWPIIKNSRVWNEEKQKWENKIWGWNVGGNFNGFHVQQIRFSEDSLVNTQGTMYHETAHSHDQHTYQMLLIYLGEVMGLGRHNFDSGFVHGQSEKFDYIQYNENGQGLEEIGEILERAYTASAARRSLSEFNLMKFWWGFLTAYRQFKYENDDDKKVVANQINKNMEGDYAVEEEDFEEPEEDIEEEEGEEEED